MKLTKRKGFNFFRSYFDVYNLLITDADKVAFIDALTNRQFMGVKPEGLEGMAEFAYISQTNSIDSQVKGYEDKTKTKLDGTPFTNIKSTPTAPPCYGGKLPPTEQVQVEVQEKEKEKVQVKEKVKDINTRKQDFYKSLIPFLETYNKEMLKDFFEYWSEHGERDRKFRKEKEKSFNTELRLKTWFKRSKQFKEKSSAKKEKPIMLSEKMKIQHGLN